MLIIDTHIKMCDSMSDDVNNLKIYEYNILKKIGSGSSGTVYIANRLNDTEKYVLKMIKIKNNGDKKNGSVKLENVQAEINILKKISINKCIQNLLCYYDHFFTCENKIMKCIIVTKNFDDGITLKKFIEQNLISRSEALYAKKEIIIDKIYELNGELKNKNVVSNSDKLLQIKKHLKRDEYILEKINEQLEENIILTLDHDVLLRIMLNVLEAIMELNKLGIAHCDLKPDNILIKEATYEIQIIDFGQACDTECVPKGTIMYSSPETLLNHLNYENTLNVKQLIKADTFSVGLIFYELANGKLPFSLREYGYHSVKQLYDYYNTETILSMYNEDKYLIDEEINLFIESMLTINRNIRPSIKYLIKDLKNMILKYDKIKNSIVISPELNNSTASTPQISKTPQVSPIIKNL